MSWLPILFNEVFYRPLLNALVFLTGFLPFNDLGLAVIILTVLVRSLLFPLMHRSIQTQNKMKMIEPELRKIKEKLKDREEQAKRIMELYRAHGVNPLSGVLLLFAQLPILIALYLVFRNGSDFDTLYLYNFVSVPESVNKIFLGLVDLGQGSIALAFFAAVSQFIQIKLSQPPVASKQSPSASADFSKMFSWQMTYFMPVVIFFIATRFPAAVALYWTTLNIFAIVHEGFVRNKAKKIYDSGINQQSSDADSGPS